jgi:hypothetical protein
MPHSASQVLQQEFLLARAKILELAATLDRIDRAEGNVDGLPHRQLLQQGFEILIGDQGQRAQRVQMLFSRHYSADWRQTMDVR